MKGDKSSEEYLLLLNYVKCISPGETISYHQIEEDTGVRLDASNKVKLQRALDAERIEVITHKGYGIEVVDAKTAIDATSIRMNRVSNSVSRGKRTTSTLLQKFSSEMSRDDLTTLQTADSAFGAMQICSENAAFIQSLRDRKKFRPIPCKIDIGSDEV